MERQPEEYAQWIKEQQEVVRELGLALQRGGDIREQQLAEIVERSAQHYLHYFSASRAASHRNISPNSSPFMSPLERAFMWFGSMRPSLSFQLIYALTGHQIEAELEELLELGGQTADGQRPASLASLSALQLAQLSELQTFTIKEEDRVDREMAKLQQSAADHPLLYQFLGSGSSSLAPSDDDIYRSIQGSMDNLLSRKLNFLQEICSQGNLLRLSTFSRVLDILHSSFQKAQYLLASGKLQVALHHLGHSRQQGTASSRHLSVGTIYTEQKIVK